eukprot:3360711-Rhodomonas_salina.1
MSGAFGNINTKMNTVSSRSTTVRAVVRLVLVLLVNGHNFAEQYWQRASQKNSKKTSFNSTKYGQTTVTPAISNRDEGWPGMLLSLLDFRESF